MLSTMPNRLASSAVVGYIPSPDQFRIYLYSKCNEHTQHSVGEMVLAYQPASYWVGAQVSAPYSNTPKTIDRYTIHLVSIVKSDAVNTIMEPDCQKP